MVLRSERSLKWRMLSLAQTSKYVNGTSVLSIKKFRRGQLGQKGLAKLDSYCSHKLIFMLSDRIVVSNKTFMQFEILNRLSEHLHEIDCKYNVHIQAHTMKW